jgi:hypothetical protein
MTSLHAGNNISLPEANLLESLTSYVSAVFDRNSFLVFARRRLAGNLNVIIMEDMQELEFLRTYSSNKQAIIRDLY